MTRILDLLMVVVVLLLAGLFGHVEGRRHQMEQTVVHTGYPYYAGQFFGRCATIFEPNSNTPLGQACATDTGDRP